MRKKHIVVRHIIPDGWESEVYGYDAPIALLFNGRKAIVNKRPCIRVRKWSGDFFIIEALLS